MSVVTELTRIQTAKADIKASIEAKGVRVPSNALIDQYADYIDVISGGGGGNEDLIDLIERDIVTLNIPSGTTKIGKYAFHYCSSLISVTIPDSVTSIGDSAFYYCDGLTSITIPDSVTSIGSSAFYRCTGLTSVTIPDSVTSIGSSVFRYCTLLTSVTIGSGVTSIGTFVFNNCSNLASVTILAVTPPTLGTNTFTGNESGRKIYVPAESVEAYKAATGWSTYAADIEAIPT